MIENFNRIYEGSDTRRHRLSRKRLQTAPYKTKKNDERRRGVLDKGIQTDVRPGRLRTDRSVKTALLSAGVPGEAGPGRLSERVSRAASERTAAVEAAAARAPILLHADARAGRRRLVGPPACLPAAPGPDRPRLSRRPVARPPPLRLSAVLRGQKLPPRSVPFQIPLVLIPPI